MFPALGGPQKCMIVADQGVAEAPPFQLCWSLGSGGDSSARSLVASACRRFASR